MEKFRIAFDGNFFIARSTHQVEWTAGVKKFEDLDDQGIFVRKVSMDLCAQIKLWSRYVTDISFAKDYKSWRKKFYEEYKANRVLDDDTNFEIRSKLENQFYDILSDSGVICQKIFGSEADDVLSMWKYYLSTKRENLLIISADKDLNQLADDNCMVFNPIANQKTGLRKLTMNQKVFNSLTPRFHEHIKKNKLLINVVNPIEELFVKTVWGDKGDNIPNMKKGIGEKTSKKFFDTLNLKYDLTIEKLIKPELYREILNDLKSLMKLTIEETIEAYERNLKLVCLHPSVINKAVATDILKDIKEQDGKSPNINSLTDFKILLEDTDWVTDEETILKQDMPKSYDPFANLNI